MGSPNTPSQAKRPRIGKQSFKSMWTQMYPPKPTFKEENVPDLSDRVYIVTGASSGVGKETARILYSKNAKVYIAARSEARVSGAIAGIQEAHPKSFGSLVYLPLDLADLASVRAAALRYLALESKLHALFNNAAVQALGDADGSKSKTVQGHEVHLGVNVLGPYLFTRLLTPLLVSTARLLPPGTVRVVWVSSMGTEAVGEMSRGLSPDYVHYWPLLSPLERYGTSKAGNWLHGVEFARRHAQDGIMSVPINPGHLASDLYRDGGTIFKTVLKTVALFPPVNGAYVELYAAFSPELTMKHSGDWGPTDMTLVEISQTAVVQSKAFPRKSGLPLSVAHDRPLPPLPTPYHVRVRVLAVGLNPTDYKMVTHFYMEGNTAGCDFCGIVQDAGSQSLCAVGTRVTGADFPYRPANPYNGAFAEYAVADSRHLLVIPEHMASVQAAAIGAIGWGTAALAISDPEALNLPGLPSKPAQKPIPVLVYGGATATGIIAIQMLKLSGYNPIAVCSEKSAPFVMKLGCIGTASYTSPTCAQEIKKLAGGVPIKHALDCITDAESAAICFGSLSRVGGRYACLEAIPEAWITRRAVTVKVVMGFEGQNYDVDLGHPIYSRKANPALHAVASRWAHELQPFVSSEKLLTQPIREIEGGFEGVITALEMLQSGEVKGEKLVVNISPS
ncbi:hypothetical protein Hte_008433 [Hypoxylon texense]